MKIEKKMNHKEITDYLIGEIKESINSEEQKYFVKSLENLTNKFESVANAQSMDSFSVECLELFHTKEIGFPDEIYKGISEEDLKTYLNDIARSLKSFLCQTFKNNPDKNFIDASNDAWKDYLKYVIQLTLVKIGISYPIITIIYGSFIIYCVNNSIKDFCNE